MPRYAFRPRASYLSFLSMASHEFIHTWNVKAYRSAGLLPYNYLGRNIPACCGSWRGRFLRELTGSSWESWWAANVDTPAGQARQRRAVRCLARRIYAGDKVRVTYFRRDQIGERELVVGALAKGPLKIVPVETPTEAQKALFQRWLLTPYPAGSK